MSLDARVVAERVAAVKERIERAGDGRPVTIVAVTKGFGAEAARIAMECGLDAIGENYAQELVVKASELDATGLDPTWHFLGRLQRNKVRHLAAIVDVWQSVDRPELADEISRRAPGARILVQANLSEEPQKGGASLGDVTALVAHAREAGLVVEGLMGVAAAGSLDTARADFRALVALADELGLAERSIGMSADMEVAVQEGATMVRLGRGLFGPRPPRVDQSA